ncbi:thioredoxin domain-containing protein [Microtetraspora sp. NBRC 16547]|uniref:thioredoxin family protein n=1 Tax=Microtetraspora sp. NBRC 16547 TaxID=3030993 RepID=UPI0024A3C323|nr:thioredoxin domain-containing protein [Microtetraspora sp. NBRC 16547]GLW99047.1 putative thioredoxin-2 [Microtetraspora sp. NBRC 16547]
MVTELTKGNWNATVDSDGIVFVDFWAAWCGPCRRFAPIFEAVAARNPDIVFGKVDTEAERELAGAFRITSIPTLVAIRDGIVLFAQPGALSEAALDDLVAKVRAADMAEIRRHVTGRPAVR